MRNMSGHGAYQLIENRCESKVSFGVCFKLTQLNDNICIITVQHDSLRKIREVEPVLAK